MKRVKKHIMFKLNRFGVNVSGNRVLAYYVIGSLGWRVSVEFTAGFRFNEEFKFRCDRA